MPVYEYACLACAEPFEELVRSPETRVACPSCGADEVERRLSVPARAARASSMPDYSRVSSLPRPAGGARGCGHAH